MSLRMVISAKWVARIAVYALLAALLVGCAAGGPAARRDTIDPQTRFADLDGVRVHYQSYAGKEPAVVFIHGWTCDHSFWDAQVPALRGKYRLILLDLPGHGLSSAPDLSYTQNFFAQAVDVVLRDAGVERAVLVGHSMGLPIARQFIRNYPDRTQALVNVDGVMLSVPPEPEKYEQWQQGVDAFTQRFRGPEYPARITEFIDSLFTEQTPAELRERIKSGMRATPQHVAASAMEGIADAAVWREDPVDVPTLAVYAKASDLPADIEEKLRRLFPKLEYYQWDDAGHFLMMEQPERFNHVLVDFLRRNCRPGAWR